MSALALNTNQERALAWAREARTFSTADFRNAGISSNTMNSLFVRRLVTYDTGTHRYTVAPTPKGSS
jgi:hypothetical protein